MITKEQWNKETEQRLKEETRGASIKGSWFEEWFLAKRNSAWSNLLSMKARGDIK